MFLTRLVELCSTEQHLSQQPGDRFIETFLVNLLLIKNSDRDGGMDKNLKNE